MRGFLDDVRVRADTLPLLVMRGSINSRIGNDEQALEDLVAADQITPIVAVNTCDRLEDTLNESGASQSRMAKLTALRHSIHTRLQVSFCLPSTD